MMFVSMNLDSYPYLTLPNFLVIFMKVDKKFI